MIDPPDHVSAWLAHLRARLGAGELVLRVPLERLDESGKVTLGVDWEASIEVAGATYRGWGSHGLDALKALARKLPP